MSDTKWTHGPWRLVNYGDVFGPPGGDSGDGVTADPDDGWQIAEVGVYEAFVDGELIELGGRCREANMALISAAPDMAAAIQSLSDSLEGRGVEVEEAIGACREALAKAKGESS